MTILEDSWQATVAADDGDRGRRRCRALLQADALEPQAQGMPVDRSQNLHSHQGEEQQHAGQRTGLDFAPFKRECRVKDGYTLLQAASPNAINATLYDNLSFNFIRDIAPVASIMRYPYVMVVNPSLPAKTVAEFIAYANANPGKINMASAGNGTAPHVFGALFMMMTGVNMLHVAYRGSYFSDLIGGQVQVVFSPLPSTIGYIRAGTLRPLAVTTATRSDALPDIPTVGDFVPGYEASSWQGVGAPKNTPAAIVDMLNREINAVIDDPKMKARLADLGGTVLSSSPADFGKLIADETDKWAKVIKTAGIKPE